MIKSIDCGPGFGPFCSIGFMPDPTATGNDATASLAHKRYFLLSEIEIIRKLMGCQGLMLGQQPEGNSLPLSQLKGSIRLGDEIDHLWLKHTSANRNLYTVGAFTQLRYWSALGEQHLI